MGIRLSGLSWLGSAANPKMLSRLQVPVASLPAVGGTFQQLIYDLGSMRYLAFRFTGAGTITPAVDIAAKALIVGGGGGGGGDSGAWGGPAGRGGNILVDVTLLAKKTYSATPGGGGGGSYYGGAGTASSLTGPGVSLTANAGTGSGPNYSGTNGTPVVAFPLASAITGTLANYSGYEDGTYGAAGGGDAGRGYVTSGGPGVVVVLVPIGPSFPI